jgi:hypothetical protein
MAGVGRSPPEGVHPPNLAAIVKYSRESTLMQPITTELWTGLTDHFDTKQILDIFIVGMDQIISRMHATILTGSTTSPSNRWRRPVPSPCRHGPRSAAA